MMIHTTLLGKILTVFKVTSVTWRHLVAHEKQHRVKPGK